MSAPLTGTASAAPLMLLGALLSAPRRSGAVRLLALTCLRRRRSLLHLHRNGTVLIGAVVGLLVGGPGGAVAGIWMTVGVARARARHRAGELATARAAELADALRRITDELRAGGQPATALAGVPADGPHAAALLGPAAHAARLGDDVAAALRHSAADQPGGSTELDRVAAAWSLADRHGVPLAELLAGVHDDIRWRVRFGAGVRAQLAGPRATAGVLTALPVLGMALGQLMGADPIGVFRSGVLGQVLLVTGVGLLAAGRSWTEQILRAAVPR